MQWENYWEQSRESTELVEHPDDEQEEAWQCVHGYEKLHSG